MAQAHIPPQPSDSPHFEFSHEGLQHVPAKQVWSERHFPQLPPQPSEPQDFPAHFGEQQDTVISKTGEGFVVHVSHTTQYGTFALAEKSTLLLPHAKQSAAACEQFPGDAGKMSDFIH